jgi:uncharacterized protein YbaR (Trm112 family)
MGCKGSQVQILPSRIKGENNLDQKLLNILACPICKGPLIFDAKRQELICRIDKLGYPIRDDIPIMLVDEARQLTEQEKI